MKTLQPMIVNLCKEYGSLERVLEVLSAGDSLFRVLTSKSFIASECETKVSGEEKSVADRLASGELRWLRKKKRTERVWIKMPRLVPEEAAAEEEEEEEEREGLIARLERGGGRNFVMMVEKILFQTDVVRNNNRLSMPKNQLSALPESFLTPEELAQAKTKRGLTVVTVDEEEREYGNMRLRLWLMKEVGIYNIVTDWFNLVNDNRLRRGHSVQVFAFRTNHHQLRFAVLRV